MNLKLLIVLSLCIFLSGCNITPTPCEQLAIQSCPTVVDCVPQATESTAKPSPASTVAQTTSPTSNTGLSPTEVVIPFLPPDIIQHCGRAYSSWSPDSLHTGTIIYIDRTRDGIWSIRNDRVDAMQLYPTSTLFDYAFSPDGTRLIVVPSEGEAPPQNFIVMNSDGENRSEYPINWFWYPYDLFWFDDAWIGVQKDDSILLISPETGQQESFFEYPAFPPNMYIIHASSPQSSWKFNPDRTMVAYQQADDLSLVLLDLVNDQIFRIPARPVIAFYSGEYHWSPQGNFIAYISDQYGQYQRSNPDELFILNMDTQITRVTDFSSYYSQLAIHIVRWSPNEQYIAMWVTGIRIDDPSVEETRLYILDLQNHQLYDYCLLYNYTDIQGAGYGVIWSPDGSQLITTAGNEPTVVVDLESGEIVELPQNILPRDWGH